MEQKYIPDQWTRKGKKYQTKCLAALKILYGADKDCQNAQEENKPNSKNCSDDPERGL